MPLQEAPYLKSVAVKTLAPVFRKYDKREQYDWEPNTPFNATLKIVKWHGSNILVEDIETGAQYWILPSYLIELIHLNTIHDSTITGTWEVTKHGQAFSVKLV